MNMMYTHDLGAMENSHLSFHLLLSSLHPKTIQSFHASAALPSWTLAGPPCGPGRWPLFFVQSFIHLIDDSFGLVSHFAKCFMDDCHWDIHSANSWGCIEDNAFLVSPCYFNSVFTFHHTLLKLHNSKSTTCSLVDHSVSCKLAQLTHAIV